MVSHYSSLHRCRRNRMLMELKLVLKLQKMKTRLRMSKTGSWCYPTLNLTSMMLGIMTRTGTWMSTTTALKSRSTYSSLLSWRNRFSTSMSMHTL